MTEGHDIASGRSRPTTREKLRSLYFGDTPQARRFRYGLVTFDLITIAIFIVAATVQDQWWLIPLDLLLALLLSLDLAARLYAEDNRREHLFSFATLADLVVIGSLLAPAFVENLAFLRVVRALRLLRSYHLVRDLREISPRFRLYEDVIQRTVNFAVFLFVVTSVVFVTQNDINPGVKTYLDALYFTITTLTTTGFGDITLVGTGGRLMSVLIMIVGVSLFLQLLRAVFQPNKVRYECQDCGLQLHDIDAIRCKHCGRTLHIPYEGAV